VLKVCNRVESAFESRRTGIRRPDGRLNHIRFKNLSRQQQRRGCEDWCSLPWVFGTTRQQEDRKGRKVKEDSARRILDSEKDQQTFPSLPGSSSLDVWGSEGQQENEKEQKESKRQCGTQYQNRKILHKCAATRRVQKGRDDEKENKRKIG